MDVIRVCGGHPITGRSPSRSAKNSALKLMAATVMAPGVTTLTNVPDIADVHVMGKVLKRLGAHIMSRASTSSRDRHLRRGQVVTRTTS